jgi:glycosyltransferase involved in cell wall biosynthesis
LKVGYILKTYPRFSQTFIVNEILAHERAGLDLEIFSLRPAKDEQRHGAVDRVRAPVTYLPGPDVAVADFWREIAAALRELPGAAASLAEAAAEPPAEVFQALTLARLARERGIGHLHAHFGNVATSVARLAARFAGIEYSFTAHARDIFHVKVVPAELRRKLAQAKAVVTVSEFNLGFLREQYGEAARGVRRIYNGIDMKDFAWAAPRDRPPTVVTVGRLVDKKGFSDLVDACALLAAGGRAFDCQIVGSGPLDEALKAQIERLGLADRVHMLGLRRQEEVKTLIQGASVMAAPCVVGADNDQDGLPTVILESMALGTPCVSTDVTGIPEVLHDQSTGLMVPQHAPEQLAAAIARLLDDADLRVRLATNARRLMEAEFDIDRNAQRIRAVFDEPAAA